VIKLDIINEVVAKTGITKTKAELAVETVFESMKKALAGGNRIELRDLACSMCVRARRGLGAIRGPGLRFRFRRDAPCASSRGKNCSRLIEEASSFHFWSSPEPSANPAV